jgi:hypothetical protein
LRRGVEWGLGRKQRLLRVRTRQDKGKEPAGRDEPKYGRHGRSGANGAGAPAPVRLITSCVSRSRRARPKSAS